jgi:hypothetical protein
MMRVTEITIDETKITNSIFSFNIGLLSFVD